MNPVSRHEVGARCTVVLGGARIASDGVDSVAMRAVEGDNVVCRGLEGCACFVFYQEGVKISTKTVAKEEETGETTDGGGMDRTLIVYRKFEAGEVSVYAGAGGD
jgi:hypothetical protein